MKKLLYILIALLLLMIAWCVIKEYVKPNDCQGEEPRKEFTIGEVLYAAKELDIPFNSFTPYNLKLGMDKELEHGRCDPKTNVTNDDVLMTAKIAWAHLNKDCKCYCTN